MSGIDAGELLKGLGVVIAVLAGFSGMAYVMKGTDLLRSGIGIAMIALAVVAFGSPTQSTWRDGLEDSRVGMLAVAVGVMVLAQAAWMSGGMRWSWYITYCCGPQSVDRTNRYTEYEPQDTAIGILALAAALCAIALIVHGV